MKRSNRIKWGEIRVGLLITIVIVILLWASFSGGGTSIFESKITYNAYFKNANGLVPGAPVWLSGVEVGNVRSVTFVNLDPERQLEMKLSVLSKHRHMITEDATITLGTIGLLGDKYVEITPGDLSKPEIPENGVIETKKAENLSAVFAEGSEALSSTQQLLKNLSDLTGRLKRGEGSVGRMFTEDTLYNELTTLLASVTVLVGDLQKNQERLTASIENVAGNIGNISDKVDSNSGTIGKLISDPGVYDNIHSSTGRLDSILAKVERGDGTAGAMVNDAELYEEVKNLVVRIDNLVADIEKNPRKYFKFSVF